MTGQERAIEAIAQRLAPVVPTLYVMRLLPLAPDELPEAPTNVEIHGETEPDGSTGVVTVGIRLQISTTFEATVSYETLEARRKAVHDAVMARRHQANVHTDVLDLGSSVAAHSEAGYCALLQRFEVRYRRDHDVL